MAATQPINRLLQQLIRDRHLTFNQKCRDLVMQIFGHEAVVRDGVGVAHCTVFDIDFYLLRRLRLKDLALRKLFNPFKWIEFLLVAPLELLNWSSQHIIVAFHQGQHYLNEKKAKDGKSSLFVASFFWDLFMLLVLYPVNIVLNVAVNLVTGVLRRLVAPVRYLVRPAIEMQKRHPKTFLAVLTITAAVAIGLVITAFTGGFGGLFFLAAAATKIAAIALVATAVGAFLTKGANLVREFFNALTDPVRPFKEQVKTFRELDREIVNQSTEEITVALHNLDKDHTEVRAPEKQDCHYKMALFTGTESFFYPKKPIPSSVNNDSPEKTTEPAPMALKMSC